MTAARRLLVIADDFGLGPATSQGILDLAMRGRVTGTVLLVNSPHAAEGVARWRTLGRPLELGWHPNLTLDRPLSPIRRVPSLVSGDGSFHRLRAFLLRLFLGQIRTADVETELRAQWRRFVELVGHPPRLVAPHQHVALFSPCGRLLRAILSEARPLPYLRPVVEPWSLWRRIPGVRFKRLLLNLLGRRGMTLARQVGFPQADHLLGLNADDQPRAEDFFLRGLQVSPGPCVELVCHPGHFDETLYLRDPWQMQRPQELALLQSAAFLDGVRSGGWKLTSPADLLRPQERGLLAA